MLGLLSLTIILYHLTWGRIRVKRRKRHSFREPPSENKSRVRQRVREEREQHHESGENNPSQAGVDESQRNGDGVQVLPAQAEVQPCPSPSSSSTTDRGGTASPSPTLDSMETTDPPLTLKDNTVHQDSKKNSNDDSQVCSAQGVVQPCPATSSSVTNGSCGSGAPVLVNDRKTKTNPTLVPKVDLVQQDTKKNSDNDPKVPSAQVDVKPCPAISSSVRTDCRGAASPDPANDCTAKTNSTLVDLVHQDTKGNAVAVTRVVSTKPDEQRCPAPSSVFKTDYSGNALPVMATDSTAKINSILASGIDKRNGNIDTQVRSAKPGVQPCRAAMSLTGDVGGAVMPVLATDLTARKDCSWATIVDMIRRDPKGFADNILSAIVDVKPRPATCLSLTKDCSDSASHVPATDDFPAKTNCTLPSKADMVHQVAKRKGNHNIQVRSVNPDAQPGQAANISSPVLVDDNAAKKDCAWTTIIDVFRRDPKGFTDKVRSAAVDIKPRPATCLALTKNNCTGPASPVPDTGFPTNKNCTSVSKGVKAHQVENGLADKVLPAKTDVKPRPATCLLLTKDSSGPASRDAVSDFPTKTKCTLDFKGDQNHEVEKGNDDNPLSANVDVQSRPATSLSLTIGCGGATSHVRVTDRMAKSDCNITSKRDVVFKDTEVDKQLCSTNSMSSTTPDGAASSVLAADSIVNTDSIFFSKVDKICHDTKRDKADRIQVFAPKTEVKPCLTTSSPPSTTECHGAASLHIVGTDAIAMSDVTEEPKVGMVRQDTKEYCDDIQTFQSASSLSTISCEGAAAFVPVTDLMAETDSTLTSKHDRNDEQVSSPSFDEMMDFLGLSFNADDATAGSIGTLKNDGFCLPSEPNDTKALIEAAAKIKMPPRKPKRRRSIRTGNSMTIVTGTPTPGNDGNTIRLLKSSTDSAPAPLSHSPLIESPLSQSPKDVDGRAYGDNTSTSVSMAAKDTHDDDKASSTMISKEAPFLSIRDDEQRINTRSNIKGKRKRRISLSSIKKRILSTLSRSRKGDEVPLLSEEFD